MVRIVLALLLCVIASGNAKTQVLTADEFRADYLQVCRLITSKYIYFERKCPLTRGAFLEERTRHADSIDWSRDTFISELRGLRGMFADGHFDWSIPRELSPIDGYYTLGFAATFTADGALIVKAVYPHYNRELLVGDEITEVNGLPAGDCIKAWGRKAPQSTTGATDEVAARNISLLKPRSPLIDKLEPVEVKVIRDGREFVYQLPYRRCPVTIDIAESRRDSTIVLLQRNGYVSLEAIPDGSLAVHPSLLLYELEVNGKRCCVLHPRDFMSWKVADIDTAMGLVNDLKPDALVIDLKDCSGGAFNHMLYLSHAVGVREDFRFFFDVIDSENRRLSGVDDFNSISDRIVLKNSWTGTLFVRSNEICGSGGDFFVRWMKLHDRATIIGTPPAGRGGGTDSFVLDHTKASISFPLRERIPLCYPSSVEGETMEMDVVSELDLDVLLEELYVR